VYKLREVDSKIETKASNIYDCDAKMFMKKE
jgi:hypothetical protein